MAAVTILKSDERSTGPSLGTNSNTLPARGRVVEVKWLVRLCHCKVPARMDHVAEIAVLARVMVSAFWAACTLGSGAACPHPGEMARTISNHIRKRKNVRGILRFPWLRGRSFPPPEERLRSG